MDQEAQELLVIGDQEKVRTIVSESYVFFFFFFLDLNILSSLDI